jgi:hypothetical protein
MTNIYKETDKIVAIHQPNYFPWFGFFYKIAKSDIFIFLDNVQYSKNSYINRTKIQLTGKDKWLSIPVKVPLGTDINQVCLKTYDWVDQHMSIIENYYRKALFFDDVFPYLCDLYKRIPQTNIADVNIFLIQQIVLKLNISTKFKRASSIQINELKNDDRLVSLVNEQGFNMIYLSGKGGSNYQDDDKFINAGIDLQYVDFEHPVYNQANEGFLPGLSILDILMNCGWDKTSCLIKEAGNAS